MTAYVTSWSRRKRHISDPIGKSTLCNADVVTPEWFAKYGMDCPDLDSLPVCKRCEKASQP